VYQSTIGKVSPTDGVVLHHARIEEILKWTKEHLDAYLASADVIIDQRDVLWIGSRMVLTDVVF
jgi:hypothetical protein